MPKPNSGSSSATSSESSSYRRRRLERRRHERRRDRETSRERYRHRYRERSREDRPRDRDRERDRPPRDRQQPREPRDRDRDRERHRERERERERDRPHRRERFPERDRDRRSSHPTDATPIPQEYTSDAVAITGADLPPPQPSIGDIPDRPHQQQSVKQVPLNVNPNTIPLGTGPHPRTIGPPRYPNLSHHDPVPHEETVPIPSPDLTEHNPIPVEPTPASSDLVPAPDPAPLMDNFPSSPPNNGNPPGGGGGSRLKPAPPPPRFREGKLFNMCYNCGEFGHKIVDCPYEMRDGMTRGKGYGGYGGGGRRGGPDERDRDHMRDRDRPQQRAMPVPSDGNPPREESIFLEQPAPPVPASNPPPCGPPPTAPTTPTSTTTPLSTKKMPIPRKNPELLKKPPAAPPEPRLFDDLAQSQGDDIWGRPAMASTVPTPVRKDTKSDEIESLFGDLNMQTVSSTISALPNSLYTSSSLDDELGILGLGNGTAGGDTTFGTDITSNITNTSDANNTFSSLLTSTPNRTSSTPSLDQLESFLDTVIEKKNHPSSSRSVLDPTAELQQKQQHQEGRHRKRPRSEPSSSSSKNRQSRSSPSSSSNKATKQATTPSTPTTPKTTTTPTTQRSKKSSNTTQLLKKMFPLDQLPSNWNQDFYDEYYTSLVEDYTVTAKDKKYVMFNLTTIAKESKEFYREVVQAIVTRLVETEYDHKLDVWYLIDNICKKVGGRFLGGFEGKILDLIDSEMPVAGSLKEKSGRMIDTWANIFTSSFGEIKRRFEGISDVEEPPTKVPKPNEE